MSRQYDILVIDDEHVVVDVVGKICSSENLSVDFAVEAQTALEKIDKNNYRLIVCDIMMPEMDGFGFLEEMHKKKISTPLIMTTGYSTVENAVRSLYSGAIDFIPKPFTADELLSSVYRGLKYGEIQTKINSAQTEPGAHPLIYVPCPARYYRLGYASWLSVEREGSVKLGVTDMFLRTIENISSITLMETDNEIIQGSSCAQIKSENDIINYVLAPVSGRIIESNEELLHNMSILEKDPYFKGWIYRLIPTDIEYQLKHLTPCSSDRI